MIVKFYDGAREQLEPVPRRARRIETSKGTLYRRIAGFEEGKRRPFGSRPAKGRVLPRSVRRLVADLKAEHPALNLNERRR